MLFEVIRDGVNPNRTDRHVLAGFVTVDGVPAKKFIAVINRATLVLVAGVWSDPVTGAWRISGIEEHPERRLLVIAFDNTGNYNAEVADYISQVATA